MRKLKIFVLALGLFSMVLYESCDRPEPVPECCYDCSCHYPCDNLEDFTYPYTDTLYLSDSFLSYWYFPVGSWWVYKRLDTAADVYDTARVVNQDRGIACNCKLLGNVCKERAMQEINHSYSFPEYNPKLKPGEVSSHFDTNLEIDWVFVHGLRGGGGAPHITLPLTAAEELGYSIFYEKRDEFKTSRYTFKKPVIYHHQNPRVPADPVIRKTNVLVKDVGWVYFYDRDLSKWELIDFKIAKP
ncbi:MAG: hypothetical protein KDC92_06760 [Bacteroidetes bacterium]|nr:hypothetical protein [Bacteroidota bacterium]